MGSNGLIIFLLWVVLLVTYAHGSRSRYEDLELEKLIKFRKEVKPVKIIKTQTNDIYDCFDIRRQPALYLKNHRIQIKPTSFPTTDINSNFSSHSLSILTSIDCPRGTVPIRRFSKEDLVRIHSFSKSHIANIHPQSSEQPGKHFAIVTLKQGKTFGAKASINLQNLTVGSDQWSTSQMWVENNANNQINSLQAGWTVAPPLNGDGATRLFAYWNGGTKGACFNHFCDAFVQVDHQYPVDCIIRRVSQYAGEQMDLILSIFKDNVTGNWWLQVNHGPNGSVITKIGYWKKDAVPQLEHGASYVAWGGLASFPAQGPAPPLGNGHPFDYNEDYIRHSYFCGLEVYNLFMGTLIPERTLLEPYVTNKACYGVNYVKFRETLGLTFLFGGQGGNCGP